MMEVILVGSLVLNVLAMLINWRTRVILRRSHQLTQPQRSVGPSSGHPTPMSPRDAPLVVAPPADDVEPLPPPWPSPPPRTPLGMMTDHLRSMGLMKPERLDVKTTAEFLAKSVPLTMEEARKMLTPRVQYMLDTKRAERMLDQLVGDFMRAQLRAQNPDIWDSGLEICTCAHGVDQCALHPHRRSPP